MFEVDGVLRAAANELFERRDRIVTSLGRLTARRQNMSPATQAATTGRRLLRDKDKYLKSGGVVRPCVHFLPTVAPLTAACSLHLHSCMFVRGCTLGVGSTSTTWGQRTKTLRIGSVHGVRRWKKPERRKCKSRRRGDD